MSDTAVDTQNNAVHFDRMSRTVTDNMSNGFAGAFVIVPPVGDPISMLLLDNAADEALFWGTVKSRVDMIMAEIADRERGQGYGGRR